MARSARTGDALTALPGVRAAFSGARFHEAVLLLDRPGGAGAGRRWRARGIEGGFDLATHYPELGHALLVCATETRSDADIASYAAALGDVLRHAQLCAHERCHMREPLIFDYSRARARRARPVAGGRGRAPAVPAALRRRTRASCCRKSASWTSCATTRACRS